MSDKEFNKFLNGKSFFDRMVYITNRLSFQMDKKKSTEWDAENAKKGYQVTPDNEAKRAYVDTGGGKNTTPKPAKTKAKAVEKPAPKPVCPEKPKTAIDSMLDGLQTALDWIGWIPGFGDICDGINAVILYLRNDLIGALISVTCIVFTLVADAILKPLKKTKTVQKVVEVIHDKFSTGVSKIAEWVGTIANKIKNAPIIGKLFNKISEGFTSFKKFITEQFDKVKNKVAKKSASGVNKINIDQKPNVSNDKLKNIINDLYKGQGGKNTVGNGTTMDAVRNEILTGKPTNGRFHTKKLKDYQNGLQRRLRAGDLNDYDTSVVNALIADITKALNGQ